MTIRIGIMGYGNLGRGVECAIKQNPDMELAAVFTRRDPKNVRILTEDAKVYHADDQDLCRRLVVLGKEFLIYHHEACLTDRRVSLFLGNRLRLLSAERLAPRRDRTGGDKDHFFSHSSHIADDADQFLDLCKVQVSGLRMCQ